MRPVDKKKDLFREKAFAKLTTPEQIDKLLVVMTPKGWIALLTLFALIFAAIVWSIFGQIPISLEGKGIILTNRGVFNVVSTTKGIVTETLIKNGEWFTHETPLFKVNDTDLKEVRSLLPGRALEIYVQPGDFVEYGAPLLWAQHPQEKGESYVCYAYFPASLGEKIKVGMEAKIALENVDIGRYGYLLGKVSEVSAFPLSERALLNRLRNPDMIQLLKMGHPAVIETEITLLKDAKTPSGYSFTTKEGPVLGEVQAGVLSNVRIVLETKTPLSYLFPAITPSQKIESLSRDHPPGVK